MEHELFKSDDTRFELFAPGMTLAMSNYARVEALKDKPKDKDEHVALVEWLLPIMVGHVDGRVAFLVDAVARTFPDATTFRINQSDMALLLGVSRSYISMVMAKLDALKVIKKDGYDLTVKNRQRLTAFWMDFRDASMRGMSVAQINARNGAQTTGKRKAKK